MDLMSGLGWLLALLCAGGLVFTLYKLAHTGKDMRLFSDHGGELLLLAMVAGGVIWLLGRGIERGMVESGLDVAAFLLVLQRIVEAVQKRWEQRSVDREREDTTKALAASGPAVDSGPPPKDVGEAADKVAGAADAARDKVKRG